MKYNKKYGTVFVLSSLLLAIFASVFFAMKLVIFKLVFCNNNNNNNNIPLMLSTGDYKQCADEEYILFVDGYDRTCIKHRHLLLRLLMTACDLSDQTKSFDNSKAIAVSIGPLLLLAVFVQIATYSGSVEMRVKYT